MKMNLKLNIFYLLLLASSSIALEGQKSRFNVRKQFEYLESMIHRNAFSLRDDLYALQEQVNASLQAAGECYRTGTEDTCNMNYQKDDLEDVRERMKLFANGFGKEKKIADSYRQQQQNELQSSVDMFNSKFSELEKRIGSLENESHFAELASRITNLETTCSKCDDLESKLSQMETFTKMDSRVMDLENYIRHFNCTRRNGFVWGTSCYILNTTKRTWDDAVEGCTATGGHLATLESESEMQNILPRLGSDTWIGANNRNAENRWEWIKAENGENTEIDFLLWIPGQPNGSGDCLEVWHGQLNDDNCVRKNQFACEYEF